MQALNVVLFCVICQIGAPESVLEQSSLSVDDLADQVAEVLEYFGYAIIHGRFCFTLLFLLFEIRGTVNNAVDFESRTVPNFNCIL